MVQVLVFAITIFIGWIIFDFVKHKKITKENIFSALVSAVVAGIAYYIFFGLF